MSLSMRKIYISTFVNSFGSWLTFLAIAMLVKERYGGQQVAWIFLVQTLPAIFFSRGLSQLIPRHLQERCYRGSQLLLALNCLVLCFVQTMPVIYIHLFVAALLKSISTPLFNTLIGKWTPQDKIDEVFIKIGSIQTATLGLAPIIGAWIKIIGSTEILFFLDAASFVVGVLIISSILKSSDQKVEKFSINMRSLFASVASVPKSLPKELWFGLGLWFSFLTLGALINALEFARFEQLAMNEAMVGYALAAWGIGSLFSFAKKIKIPLLVSGTVFLISLALFLASPSAWMVIGAFAIAGWASSVFSGSLRGQIQRSVPPELNALPIWSFANQIIQLINLVAYVGVGLLLSVLGFNLFTILVVLVGTLMLAAIAWSPWNVVKANAQMESV
jgi:MFS family permease